jgi:hypothetical protein
MATLSVTLRPQMTALFGVVSVLHARAADVTGMTYAVGQGAARLLVEIEAGDERARRLALHIDRRADVLDVQVRLPVSIPGCGGGGIEARSPRLG